LTENLDEFSADFGIAPFTGTREKSLRSRNFFWRSREKKIVLKKSETVKPRFFVF